MKIEDLPSVKAARLVKSVDLNHHGTLFAGRMAEWLVEVGFMTARAALECPPTEIVCVRLHGMDFRRSVPSGATLALEGRVVHVGTTSVTVFVEAGAWDTAPISTASTGGFATFVRIVEGKAIPHGLVMDPPQEPHARQLWDQVAEARRQRRPV
ncbi:MAG: acyl-CoA thioesterase [Anaerolineae bacterium]|nr:acyl-CoA thioesterase [Anaerolineae bacterium]